MKISEKYRMQCYRVGLSLVVLFLLLFTKGETEKLAPFALVFILLIAAGLVFLRNTRLLTLPFLLLCLLLIFCYDSYDFFIRYIWLAPIVIVAILVHVIRLRPRLLVGRSFYPLVAVSVATVLGGVGMISAEEYFRPVALFYVFGLGPGLVLVYLLLKNEFRTKEDERSFLADLMMLAVTAALVVFGNYFLHLPSILADGRFPTPQWSNNIGTLLMLSFPPFFVMAGKRYRYLFLGLFTAFAAIICGSNGALVAAGCELLVCLCYLLWIERRPRYRWITGALLLCAVVAATAIVAWVFLMDPLKNMSFSLNSRVALLQRGWTNFLENPLFGSGFGYLGNADLYTGKKGTINWYHLFVAQVAGGLGIAGILAWGYQLLVRFRLAFAARGRASFAWGLCYLGLLAMSMINPGEFCPVPYAFLAVAFFVMLERHDPKPFEPFWHKLKKKGDANIGS